jgi:hypothetical protein
LFDERLKTTPFANFDALAKTVVTTRKIPETFFLGDIEPPQHYLD